MEARHLMRVRHEIINRIKPCWQRQKREEMMNEIRQYNERLHDMAPAYGYTVVTTDIKDEDLKSDGVHLNDTSVLKLVQTIKETFDRYSRVDTTNKTPSQEYKGRFPSNNELRLCQTALDRW
ncbi:unnamed protein product [Didymodactylos carnosus]|uniref:Uncharacterized protein n=1 Tax=Didymodactylos carnosus TaxID=1234261 RepID=A0A814JYD1_9BILA|nr:unnamed protein product [Didymodactylos carnosus]CAF1044168.1 unnamed protein product [Didymodactylos carnosus]CAF3554690.1 unnamed protein product [Didymodactylos carnosus]CAF3814202.1 unnamed protein product [Didymodactylos carnosus]